MTDTDERPTGRATIDDVAVRAGVSVATVSRALRGLPNVAPTTRQRIERVASELRYRPDPAAARLAAGRTNTITVGVPSLNGWYFSNVVAGAESACAEAGYELQVIAVSTKGDLLRLLEPSARLERRSDALVLVDIDLDDDVAAAVRDRGIAVGTIGFHVDGCPAVQLDDHLVGVLAARHLADVGCRRPAVVGGLPDAPMRFRVPDLRRSGFEAGLAERSLSLDGRIASGVFGVDGGRLAMAELLDRYDTSDPETLPDGLFAMCDELAFGAMMVLRERGIPVGVGPGSIAIIGVDDHEFSPVVELSTVRQDVPALGAMIARRLIDLLHELRLAASSGPSTTDDADDAGPVAEVVQPDIRVVRRGSTSPRPVG